MIISYSTQLYQLQIINQLFLQKGIDIKKNDYFCNTIIDLFK